MIKMKRDILYSQITSNKGIEYFLWVFDSLYFDNVVSNSYCRLVTSNWKFYKLISGYTCVFEATESETEVGKIEFSTKMQKK